MMKSLLCALLLLIPVLCNAQQAVLAAPPSGVVNLSANAMVEVDNDLMTMSLAAEAQERDATVAASKVNQALEAALKLARTYPAVTARSGGYSSTPVYDKDRTLIAWRLQSTLLLTSKTFSEMGVLAGKLQGAGLKLVQMGFTLSPEARAAVDQQLTREAITQFQERSALVAQSLGYAGSSIREISVRGDGNVSAGPFLARSMAGAADAAPPVPVAAGKTPVSVSVSGSIQLERRK